MRLLRTGVIVIAILAALTAGGYHVFRIPLAEMAFTRAVERNIGRDTARALPDGLHVYVCGAGTPMPDALRAGPCMAVIAGDTHLVFDSGSGGVRTLTRMAYPVGKIDAVFLTHLHSDHMDGLGEMMMQAWINGARTSPLPVYGPAGVEEVVEGFDAAYRIDGTYRAAHHGPEIANPSGHGGEGRAIAMQAGPGGSAVVYDQDGVTVTAYKVDHSPAEPAFGYRVDYKDRAVSFSGDTIYSPNLVAVSEGADILFHDALHAGMVIAMREAAVESNRPGLAAIFGDILDYHATPEDAAKAAEAAGVRQLVYYHTIPPLPSRALNALFMKDAKAHFGGPMDVAVDGIIWSLPAGSTAVNTMKAY
ncbi:MBL fold metallo-hydrolase [Hyphomonas sp.]|uniref:MBL fold metallo-hydrolase n=1 Tax=Hyphomonas sp. TaxID=87 RepID=UPI00391D8FFE